MSWDRYLSEVLGVRQVVWPASTFQSEASVTRENLETETHSLEQVKLLFLAEPMDTPLLEREIFQRMLTAMRIETNEYLVWEVSPVDLTTLEKEISNDWIVVSFSKKLADWLSMQRPRLSQVTTPHPAECEREPHLKRQVWDDLKRALEKAGLSARLQS